MTKALKKKPRYTYAGMSIYWTIFDKGKKLATLMTEQDARALVEVLQAQHDEIVDLAAQFAVVTTK